VFEIRVLRAVGCCRELHNKELHNVYSAQNFCRMTRLWLMSWLGHVAHMGKKMNAYQVLVHNLKERDHLEYVGINRRILKQVIKK
jgi:hypothetical protein